MNLVMTPEFAEIAEPFGIGDGLTPPSNIAEAEAALETEMHVAGQYRPETVRALLGLLAGAAENVAQLERERWAWRIRQTARQGSALTPETRAGLHQAAALIERNRETPQ